MRFAAVAIITALAVVTTFAVVTALAVFTTLTIIAAFAVFTTRTIRIIAFSHFKFLSIIKISNALIIEHFAESCQ